METALESEGRKEKKALRWDEENLDYNEENKTPKMKIDEPPTPFNFDYCDDEAGDGTLCTPNALAMSTRARRRAAASRAIVSAAARAQRAARRAEAVSRTWGGAWRMAGRSSSSA